MEIIDVIEDIESSDVFKEWDKTGYFLAHVFKMVDEANKGVWQVGYFNQESEEMVTFMKEGSQVKKVDAQEVFKEPDKTILPLEKDHVKIDWEDALNEAYDAIKDEDNVGPIQKTFFILQHLAEGVVYNITYLTGSFHTFTLHVDAGDGSVKHQQQASLLDLAEFQEGEKGKEK